MWTVNEVTKQLQQNFDAKFLKIGTTVLTNSNGTQFRIANISLPNGKIVSCRVYEKNFAKGEMVIGETYQATATQYAKGDGIGVDIVLSALTNAAHAQATMEDFDFLSAETLAPQKV